jgi:lauroyl/myristoyl acyltransferase
MPVRQPIRKVVVSTTYHAGRNCIRRAELCFALLMRIVPPKFRFDAALLLAWTIVPFFRRTRAYREQKIKGFHEAQEIALHLILNALTKNATPFIPKIGINGFDYFAQAHARGKGVLVIGHHAALTLFMVRFFYETGFNPVVITPDKHLRVPGTLVPAQTLQPSATFLVKLRSSLRRGELVCAMPDRAEHHGRRTIEFATPAGQVILAPAMIQVAARCNAAVLFTEVRAHGRQLSATIAAPASASRGNSEALTDDFISFVREQTAQRSSKVQVFPIRARGTAINSIPPIQAPLNTGD